MRALTENRLPADGKKGRQCLKISCMDGYSNKRASKRNKLQESPDKYKLINGFNMRAHNAYVNAKNKIPTRRCG